LIERKFSIYSLSEYLVSIPIVLLYELLIIAILSNTGLSNVSKVFFEYGTADRFEYEQLTGVLRTVYMSLIIAYLVSLYPKMRIKLPLDFVCIGKSQAFDNYYEEALKKIEGTTTRAFYPLSRSDGTLAINEFLTSFKRYSAKNDNIYVISTPTPYHFHYISLLANEGRFFFVEKPIVANAAELSVLSNDFDKYFRRGFFLQYYLLEKALVVTYLRYPFPEYEPFLRVRGTQTLQQGDRERLLWKFASLGNALEMDVNIMEGEDRSRSSGPLHWTEARESGGMLFDLGIHAFSLLRLIARTGATFAPRQMSVETNKERWFLAVRGG
jgi:hypothetical protein